MSRSRRRAAWWVAAGMLSAAAIGAVIGYRAGGLRAELSSGARIAARDSTLERSVNADTAPGRRGEPHIEKDAAAGTSAYARTRTIVEASGRDSTAAIAALIDRAADSTDAHGREAALDIAFERLVDLDPAAALARAQRLTPGSARRQVPLVIGAWAERDLDAATAAAFLLEPAALRHETALEILRHQGDLSPADKRNIAVKLGDPEATEWLLLESKATATAADASAALAEAVGMAGQPRRHERLTRIAELIAIDSPAAAMSLAGRITDARDRTAWQRAVAGIWADSDPAAAAAWLGDAPPGVRTRLTDAVAVPYARRDPQAALDWARRSSTTSEWGAWIAVLSTIAETDPVTAVETALAAPAGVQRQNGIAVAVAFLARKDPMLAASYLDRVQAGSDRLGATSQIAIQMAMQGDRAQALDWLAAHADPRAARSASMRIAYDWATEDPDGALRYADRLPSRDRSSWTTVVASAVADADPERVVALIASRRGEPDFAEMVASAARSIGPLRPDLAMDLADQITDPQLRDRALEGAIPNIAQRSPVDAARVIERIESDETRAHVTQMVAQVWAQSDPKGAFEWVRSLPAGSSRDQSYAALAPMMNSAHDMEAAIARIGSPAARNQAVHASVLALARQGDVDAARDLLFRHPLEPQMMQSIEAQLRDSGRSTQ
jgi:hypothetical protein